YRRHGQAWCRRVPTNVPASSRARREASPLLTISFPVNHRALAYLLGQWTALRPATQRAVLEAEDRGCITNAYYFIDVDTSIAREMRDCFRRRADRHGMEGRLCTVAASSISTRLYVAWCSHGPTRRPTASTAHI